jgi:hypothetical protein
MKKNNFINEQEEFNEHQGVGVDYRNQNNIDNITPIL